MKDTVLVTLIAELIGTLAGTAIGIWLAFRQHKKDKR